MAKKKKKKHGETPVEGRRWTGMRNKQDRQEILKNVRKSKKR